MKYTDEYLQEIIAEYQQFSKEPLTLADAEEVANNTVALFKCLKRLHQKHFGSNTTGKDKKSA